MYARWRILEFSDFSTQGNQWRTSKPWESNEKSQKTPGQNEKIILSNLLTTEAKKQVTGRAVLPGYNVYFLAWKLQQSQTYTTDIYHHLKSPFRGV